MKWINAMATLFTGAALTLIVVEVTGMDSATSFLFGLAMGYLSAQTAMLVYILTEGKERNG